MRGVSPLPGRCVLIARQAHRAPGKWDQSHKLSPVRGCNPRHPAASSPLHHDIGHSFFLLSGLPAPPLFAATLGQHCDILAHFRNSQTRSCDGMRAFCPANRKQIRRARLGQRVMLRQGQITPCFGHCQFGLEGGKVSRRHGWIGRSKHTHLSLSQDQARGCSPGIMADERQKPAPGRLLCLFRDSFFSCNSAVPVPALKIAARTVWEMNARPGKKYGANGGRSFGQRRFSKPQHSDNFGLKFTWFRSPGCAFPTVVPVPLGFGTGNWLCRKLWCAFTARVHTRKKNPSHWGLGLVTGAPQAQRRVHVGCLADVHGLLGQKHDTPR